MYIWVRVKLDCDYSLTAVAVADNSRAQWCKGGNNDDKQQKTYLLSSCVQSAISFKRTKRATNPSAAFYEKLISRSLSVGGPNRNVWYSCRRTRGRVRRYNY